MDTWKKLTFSGFFEGFADILFNIFW